MSIITKSTYYSLISIRNGLPKRYIGNYGKLVTNRPTLDCHKQFADTVIGGSWAGYKKAWAGHVRQIRGMLDDIVQCEYPSREELSGDEFFDLYYPSGVNDCLVEPTEALRSLLVLFDLSGVLNDGYDPRYKRIVQFAKQVIRHT